MSAQIKILYGHEYERCKITTISILKFKSLTLEGLESLVYSNVGSFYKDSTNLRIQYRDDKNTFVTVSNQTDVQDAIRCCKTVANGGDNNIVRLCVRVDDSVTPLDNKKKRSSPNVKAKQPKKAVTKKRRLQFLSESDSGQSDDESDIEEVNERRSVPVVENIETPLQRYMHKAKRDIDEKKDELYKLEMEERDTRRKILRVKSSAEDGNICRNCHLRLGHTARSCDFDKCQSVFKCGEEKLHPGEIDGRGTRCAVNKLKKEIAKMEQDLTNKEQSMKKLNESLPNRIERGLMEENANRYLEGGVKKWGLLRKHVYLIEKYCKDNFKGKIPAKHNVSDILTVALQGKIPDGDERQSLQVKRTRLCGSTSTRRNPAKHLLEDHGITFPLDNTDKVSTPTKCDYENTVYRCAPANETEELEQLRMVLQHSLYDCNASGETSTHPPATYSNSILAATYPNSMAATYPNPMAMIPQFPLVYPSQYGEMPNPMFYSTTGTMAMQEFCPRFPQPELQIAHADNVNKVPLVAGLSEEPVSNAPSSSEENDAALQLVCLSSIQNLQGQGTAK